MAFLICSCILIPLPSLAQDTERTVTFREAVSLLTENNLSYRLARYQVDEQAALAKQAAFYPNPSVLVSHEPLFNANGTSQSESYVNLIQPIEWSGLRSARINAANRLTDAALNRFQADSLQLLFELASTFLEAQAAAQQYEDILQITEIFREADRSASVQFEAGEMSGYQMRRLRVERARYENRLALSELDVYRAQRRLAQLILPEKIGLHVVPSGALMAPATPPELDAAIQQAFTQRAELTVAQAQLDAARFTTTHVQKDAVPAPVITAGFKRQSYGFYGVFLSTLIDVPVFDRNRGAIDAAYARTHQAETRLLLAQQQVEQEVRQAYATYISLRKRNDLLANDLLAESDALLKAAQTSYSEGEISLIELLDASDAYHDARATTTILNTRVLIAYFDLMRATGRIPLF